MGIHDGDVSLHLLDLDEPVETSLEEDFMDTRYTFSLSEHQCKRRLEISWESREYVGLDVGRTETCTRVVYGYGVMFMIEIIAHTRIFTLTEECSEIRYTSSLDADRWFCCEGTKYYEGSTLDVVTYNCRFRLFSVNY